MFKEFGRKLNFIVLGLIVLVILYKTQYEDEEKENLKEKFLSEGFANQNSGDDEKFVKVFRDTFTNPTEKNPLMNVMMDDYKYNNKKNKWPRSQDLKPTFIVNSAAFMASRKTYEKAKDRLCKNPYPLISKGNTGFDIDTRDDFEKLKKLRIQI